MSKLSLGLTTIFYFFLSSQFLFSQVRINEACSKNKTTIEDEFGDYPDWIELYNSTNSNIDLTGYFLSDDPDEPKKWTFPNIEITANSFLLIFASGDDLFDQFAHCNFKLSKSGETLLFSNPAGELIETFDLPALDSDKSYGRQPDGSDLLVFFKTTSPNASNNDSPIIEFAPAPLFSLTNHFFDEAVLLTLTSELDNPNIRYTTDGSIPNEESLAYENPIEIDSTLSIRAISLADGFQASDVISKTFFIGTDHQLPVVALSTHPDNFWDWEKGILVDGPNKETEWPFYGANYWLDIEIPVHFEYFDENGNFEIAYDLGAKIHGGRGGRTHPQKPLRLLAKKKYGTAVMDYPFFKDRENTKYKRLVLRNGSGDYNVAHFRDGMPHRMYIREGLDVDGLAYQPVVAYLNGEYYGLLNLREKADEYYLKYHYDVDIDNLDLLEEDTLISLGNFDIFNAHYDFIVNTDMSVDNNFQQAASFFDINSMIDYYVAEIGISNADSYNNNIKYWRERKEGAKWRYLLFDLDASFGRFSWTQPDKSIFYNKMELYNGQNLHINIFKSLLNNDQFKFRFLNRYADLLNTIFTKENLRDEIIFSRDLISEEMKRQFQRFPSQGGHAEWFDSKMNVLFNYADLRADFARDNLQTYFELPGQVNLQLKTYPENAGRIQINTIQPDLPWNGIYFNGVPVELTIEANSGFQFSHWQSLKTIRTKDPSQSIQYNFETDDQIIAFFETENKALNLQLSPNPIIAGKEITLSFSLDEIEKIEIQIIDSAGRLLRTTDSQLFSPGFNSYSLNTDDLAKGIYLIVVKTNKEMTTKKFVVY